jgi:hypothetical protein
LIRASAFLQGAIFVAVALVARDGWTYCRTTTEPLEASVQDPSVSGQCWTPGVDIAWADYRVPYGISTTGSKFFTVDEITPIADAAFAQWNSVMCDGGPVNVQAYDVGPLTYMPDGGGCAVSTDCQPNTDDVIVFDDDVWPHDDLNNTLALTTVTYGVKDGRIFQAFTEVNTAVHSFTTLEPPPSGWYDLQTVLSHEAGHFLGLAHSTMPSSLMWAFYSAGHYQLTPDDEAGICAIYGAKPPSKSGCESVPAGTGWNGVGVALGAGLCASVAVRRRRRTVTPRR